MSDKKLSGKIAIVTGSTSGIGLGIARELARQGADVVLNGSRDLNEDIERLVTEFRKEFGVNAIYCRADFSNAEEAANILINATIETFKTVHILVNNAGVQFLSRVEDFPTNEWDRILSINLSSCFHTMRLAIPYMKKNPSMWGRIINISSVHGKVASVNKAAYVTSKHGLNGLTKVAALENASGTNITCNAICPGWVHTPLVQKQIEIRSMSKNMTIDEATEDLVGEKQPSKKFTTPEQIGDMVTFLCSDSASNLTGSEIMMDGAWTVQ